MADRIENKIAILATGPSLTKEVIDLVVSKKYDKVIVVSDAYLLYDQADALVSTDGKWWDVKNPQFSGKKYCVSETREYEDVLKVKGISSSVNSGAFAIHVAIDFYNPYVIHLFGYNMHNRNGDHFFGKHPPGLTNTIDCLFDIFKEQFKIIKEKADLNEVTIYNCTPDSDLKCFKNFMVT